MESFNGRVRDELLDVELFSCLAEAVVVIEDWRQDYNAHRPHSALGNQTPNEFASTWRLRTTRPDDQSAISLLRTSSTNSHTRWTNNRGPVRLPPSCCATVLYGEP